MNIEHKKLKLLMKICFFFVILLVVGILIATIGVSKTNKKIPLASSRYVATPAQPLTRNLCEIEESNLNCSSVFATDSLLSNIKKEQTNLSKIKDDKVSVLAERFFVELQSNKDVYLRNLILPEFASEITAFASRTVTNIYGPQVWSELDLSDSNNPIINNVSFDNVLPMLTNETQNSKSYLLKAATPLTFEITALGETDNLNLSVNVIMHNTNSDVDFYIKVIPLLTQNIDKEAKTYIPNNNDLVFLSKYNVNNLTRDIVNPFNINLIDPSEFKVSKFDTALLSNDAPKASYDFWNNMWLTLFNDKFNNAIIPLDKQIDNYVISDANSFFPKDFLNFTNIRKLKITNLNKFPNISQGEWKAFFDANQSFTELEISNTNLTNGSFENIRRAIQESNLSSLILNLSNNNLTFIPQFTNSNIITELNLKANPIINISTLETGFSHLRKLDLSYLGALINQVPNFLLSLDSLVALNDLNLEGLGLQNSSLTLADLKNDTIISNLKHRISILNLANNGLTDLTDIFKNGNFDQLQNINLSNNELSKIPDDFWLASTISDIVLDVSNNPNLDYVISDNSDSLAKISVLNLSNTKQKTFPVSYKTNTHLKKIILGNDNELIDYNFLLNLPNSLEVLEIDKAPQLILLGDELKDKFDSQSSLSSLNYLKITNSGLEGSFLSNLANMRVLTTLDLSGNQFSSLASLSPANFHSLQNLIIKNNNYNSKVEMNINSLLRWSIFPNTQLLTINLENSRLFVSKEVSQLPIPNLENKKITVLLDTPQLLQVSENSVYEEQDLLPLLHDNITYAILNPTFDNQKTKINSQTWVLNAISYQATNAKNNEINKVSNSEITDIKSVLELDDYQLPATNLNEITTERGFASYLTRANLARTNYVYNVKGYVARFTNINDLEEQQKKVKADLDRLKDENDNLLKIIDDLKSGSLFGIVIALISIALGFNILFAGIFLYRYWKKKK